MLNPPALLLVNPCHMSQAADKLNCLLLNHYMSYDKISRAAPTFILPPIEHPTEQLTSLRFYQLTGFWPVQFEEVSRELVLLPEHVKCKIRVTASRNLALFVLL